MKPSISIIIIVKNDRGIADTLEGLRSQEKPAPTEVLVVDASHPSVLADIREKYPEVKWYQFVPTNPKKTSIPEQRNFGIQQSQGDINIFIDANCIPSEGWLVKITAPLLDTTEAMAAGAVEDAHSKTQESSSVIQEKKIYLPSSPTINLAFKKDVWRSVGGFDESFYYGSDLDFTWRCIDAGYKILSVPDARISHNWGSFKDEVIRSFKYGKARTDLLFKHYRRFNRIFESYGVIIIYSIWIIGLPLTYFFIFYPVSIVFLMLKNINNRPFMSVILGLVCTLGFYKRLGERMWLK